MPLATQKFLRPSLKFEGLLIGYQTWRCDVRIQIQNSHFSIWSIDNISRYMEFKVCSIFLKAPKTLETLISIMSK